VPAVLLCGRVNEGCLSFVIKKVASDISLSFFKRAIPASFSLIFAFFKQQYSKEKHLLASMIQTLIYGAVGENADH